MNQGWSGEGPDNGKPERRAEHATERSAVECEDRERRLPIIAAPGGLVHAALVVEGDG